MPEEGIDFVKRSDLLSFEEMERLLGILHPLGISKIRITGGEPFLRKDLMHFLERISKIGFEQISITTNGSLITKHIDKLKLLGIRHINFSLDTLDRVRFHQITRRDQFDEIWDAMIRLLDEDFVVKINMVVMEGINDMDIIPMALLASRYNVDMRFIEEMPFNGTGEKHAMKWTSTAILDELKKEFPHIKSLPFQAGSTAALYEIEEFKGNLGIIAAYTRSFCGSCNRLRITPTGLLKTCLYDKGVFNLKSLLRQGADDMQITEAIVDACSHRAKDGWEAEKLSVRSTDGFESMATIGG
jgi:cyclic pyranopterin phosphate synthase